MRRIQSRRQQSPGFYLQAQVRQVARSCSCSGRGSPSRRRHHKDDRTWDKCCQECYTHTDKIRTYDGPQYKRLKQFVCCCKFFSSEIKTWVNYLSGETWAQVLTVLEYIAKCLYFIKLTNIHFFLPINLNSEAPGKYFSEWKWLQLLFTSGSMLLGKRKTAKALLFAVWNYCYHCGDEQQGAGQADLRHGFVHFLCRVSTLHTGAQHALGGKRQ